ncbi:unnamed protein product [Sphenostylis stenocarpa]|uniref:Uncharacterized protein n=1 Tax=Sphenostylis stenocarpa TaxID=92480 RepID=A0AA86VLQ0_9FABA|nr:unnamed protein product [Sphenostylis stenocarpa]
MSPPLAGLVFEHGIRSIGRMCDRRNGVVRSCKKQRRSVVHGSEGSTIFKNTKKG